MSATPVQYSAGSSAGTRHKAQHNYQSAVFSCELKLLGRISVLAEQRAPALSSLQSLFLLSSLPFAARVRFG